MMTTNTMTDIFYFLPQTIRYSKMSNLVDVVIEEVKQVKYQKAGIIISKKDINNFLNSPLLLLIYSAGKGKISTKPTNLQLCISKVEAFKGLTEKEVMKNSASYLTLVKAIAKKILQNAESYSDAAETKKVNPSDEIRKASKTYLTIDPQVSSWLEELACFYEKGK